VNDQAGIGDVIGVAPCFNVTKTGKSSVVPKTNYRFAFLDFPYNVADVPFGDPGTALFGGFFDQMANFGGILGVGRFGNEYFKFADHFSYNLFL
jgi:hypothetical protein